MAMARFIWCYFRALLISIVNMAILVQVATLARAPERGTVRNLAVYEHVANARRAARERKHQPPPPPPPTRQRRHEQALGALLLYQ